MSSGIISMVILLSWIVANCLDSNVRPADPNDAVSPGAYLLFYRRRSEMPLGGNTTQLTADYITKTAAEAEAAEAEEDSNTTSPKADEPAQSESSSPSPPMPTLKPLTTSGSSLLKSQNSAAMASSTSLPGSWSGGWSNRLSGAQNVSVGFPFGSNNIRPTADSPPPDSESITPGDGADADVESGNDEENEAELVPLGQSEEAMDEVISIQAPDDQQAA